MRKRIITSLLILLLAMTVSAEEKMRIALMDLQANGVTQDIARTVSDLLRTELFKTKWFTVLERSEIEKILKEQGLQQTGVTELENAVKVGKILSAKKVLVGSVNKLAGSYIINARIIDVESGAVEYAETTKVASEAELDIGTKTFATLLANRINGTADKLAQDEANKKILKKAGSCCLLTGAAVGIGLLVKWLIDKSGGLQNSPIYR